MKQHEYIEYILSTTTETVSDSGIYRKATSIAAILLAGNVISGLTPAFAHASPTTPPPTTTVGPRQPLPSNWPTSVTLGQKDCRPGASIDRQLPLQLGTDVAAMVDSRCEPPQNQRFASVRSLPERQAQTIGRVFNGQFVRLDCQVEVESEGVGDDRGSFTNTQWFGITFRDRDQAQQDNYGYINGANLGQVDVSDPRFDVPPCR